MLIRPADGAFPVLAERFPELRPVLEELERDHDLVAGVLRRLEELLAGLGAEADPAQAQRVRAELGGLAALLETHFVYEEKKLVAALNSLSPRPGTLKRTTSARRRRWAVSRLDRERQPPRDLAPGRRRSDDILA